MIVAESSTWVALLAGDSGEDVQMFRRGLQDSQVLMAPVVLTDLLSDPNLPKDVAKTLLELPLVETLPGYWQRAGALRAKVLADRRRARLGDALIAQSCIDQGISLSYTRLGLPGICRNRRPRLPNWIPEPLIQHC